MKKLFIAFLGFWVVLSSAQSIKPKNSAEIYHSIEKLNFLGSALYVAAHPDDENTRLISYLSNKLHARTAYLSLTRGDGGQNRIGSELKELLGVIRTQELLAARRIDGGQQFFTRAIDFGYSKHPDETLEIWNKKEVLRDMVWIMRNFQPDVIINRFDHRTPGRTHGHHTSSAMLSLEAFDMVGSKKYYADQLKSVGTWQPKRLFFNTSWWFFGGRDKFKKADKSHLMALDVGSYLPLLAKSCTEIAAASRTMHKSQGFGSTGTRGRQMEYLELLKGDLSKDKTDIFEGINTTWSRLKNGEKIGAMVEKVLQNFSFTDPSSSVDDLVAIKKEISSLGDSYWKKVKLAEVDQIVVDCLASFFEVSTSSAFATAGDSVEIAIENINRSSQMVDLVSVRSEALGIDTLINQVLGENESMKLFYKKKIAEDFSISNPYWLNKKGSLGMFTVEDQHLIGNAENAAPLQVEIVLNVGGEKIKMYRDVVYKFNSDVKGEVKQPFYIMPPASVNFEESVIILADNNPKEITVNVKTYSDELIGDLGLNLPSGWQAEPAIHKINMKNKNSEGSYKFWLSGPKEQKVSNIGAFIKSANRGVLEDNITEISYDHIPFQIVKNKATAKAVKLDIEKIGQKVAYIRGAGDEVPKALEQIGYQVDVYEVNDINSGVLDGYDACIVGIRAYNIHKNLRLKNDILHGFAKKGGVVFVQYQTSRRLKGEYISPYHLELSRNRVTDEFAEVKFVNPDHRVLNFPNKLNSTDFENWTQERGLYFAREWDEKFVPIFSMHDKGEDPQEGSLLIAPLGEGYFVFSGISFFRQLPAGVPGAFRLLANILSLQDHQEVKP